MWIPSGCLSVSIRLSQQPVCLSLSVVRLFLYVSLCVYVCVCLCVSLPPCVCHPARVYQNEPNSSFHCSLSCSVVLSELSILTVMNVHVGRQKNENVNGYIRTGVWINSYS